MEKEELQASLEESEAALEVSVSLTGQNTSCPFIHRLDFFPLPFYLPG